MNSGFWSGKNVLVTGHTGFKGSWLSLWLSLSGAKVSGIALPPNTPLNSFTAFKLSSMLESHQIIDIRNRDALTEAVKKLNPDIVFHLAAQPLVRTSYNEPIETYETNVIGTGNLLMALKASTAARAVVVVTTDKCYENREWHWGYRETDSLGGYDPYSSSKACAEILTASFRRSFFSSHRGANPGIATVRAGNVIGGGDWSLDRLIPDLVKAVYSGEILEIRSPHAIRPWQHVLSPLEGYMNLAERLFEDPAQLGEAFNFSPDDHDCVTVQSLIDKLGKAWGIQMPWKRASAEQPHEAHFLKLDSSKARAELNWFPRWSLDQALTETAAWYKAFYLEPASIGRFTQDQIERYLSSRSPLSGDSPIELWS